MSINRNELWEQIGLESKDGLFTGLNSRSRHAAKTSRRLFEDSLANENIKPQWSEDIYTSVNGKAYRDVRKTLRETDPLSKGSIGTALKAEAITNSRNRTAAERIFGAMPGSDKFNSTQPVRGGGINNVCIQ